MLRMKRKHFEFKIYLVFVICMILIVNLFVIRIITESNVTPMSVGQTIKVSQNYELGDVLDRDGNVIVKGSGHKVVWSSSETEDAFQDILGIDITKTLGSRTTVLGNCSWVFGTEDNRFTLNNLLHPNERRTGGGVRLTIDKKLQEYICSLIADTKYENAYILVSNYKTGEILAAYGEVFSNSLHPGSTLKPILAAAALMLNPEFINYTYNCTSNNHNFQTEDGPIKINCVNEISHGNLNMSDAMAYSCNGYYISLLQHTDKAAMLDTLKKWGFDTTISYQQFMYWDHSFVGNSEKQTDYLLAAIGQSNAYITPAGLNFCTNALLNHGELVEPIWFTQKKVSDNSKWDPIKGSSIKRVCSSEVADQVVGMMEAVTEKGTGKSFYIPKFAAKTGTAQKADENGDLTGLYTLWTTGGLIDEENPYSVTVCLDNVTEEVTSAETGKIAQNILLYLAGGE